MLLDRVRPPRDLNPRPRRSKADALTVTPIEISIGGQVRAVFMDEKGESFTCLYYRLTYGKTSVTFTSLKLTPYSRHPGHGTIVTGRGSSTLSFEPALSLATAF